MHDGTSVAADSYHRTRFGLYDGQVVFLDIVRALAAGSVLLHHILLLIGRPELGHGFPFGSLGVTTFFLLSGFLIDQSAQRHAARDHNYSVREFLIDRIARIYVCFVPALVFTATLVAPLSKQHDFIGKPHFGLIQFFGNLLMLQDYPAFQIARRAGFDADWFVQPYALAEPYWTVPIELYLYIAFGVVYFCYVKRTSVPHYSVRIATCIALLPVLYHAATGYGQCLTLVWLLGVLGSRVMTAVGSATPKPTFIAFWVVASALLLALRVISRSDGFYDLQNALFLGMLLLGGMWASARLGWLSRAFIKGPAAFFAKTSYPLYLTHNVLIGCAIMHFGPDLTVFDCVLLAACCHACAFVFWWAFDRHYKVIARWLRSSTAPAQAAAAQVAQ